MAPKGIDKLLLKVITAELLGLVCSYVTKNFGDYELLSKPPLSPPRVFLPLIWIVIFFMAGLASYFVSSSARNENAALIDEALFFYKAMLCVSLLWTIFFFGINFVLLSSAWSLLLIYIATVAIVKFRAVSRKAFILLIPYLFWSIFAAYINIGIWYLSVVKA